MVGGPSEFRFSIDSIATELPLDKNYNMYLFKCRRCSSESTPNGFYEFLRETIRTHLKNRLLRVSTISHCLRPREPVPYFPSPYSSVGRHRVFVCNNTLVSCPSPLSTRGYNVYDEADSC